MHVDSEVDEEGDAVHVASCTRQVQRSVAKVVAPLGVAAAPAQQPQRVQVALERRPSETKQRRTINLRSVSKSFSGTVFE